MGREQPGQKYGQILSWKRIIGSDEKISQLVERAARFNNRLGLFVDYYPSGISFSNGRPIPLEGSYQRQIVSSYEEACTQVAKLHYYGKISQTTNIYDYLLTDPGVLKSRNPIVYPSDVFLVKFVDLCDLRATSWLSKLEYFSSVSSDDAVPLISLHIVTDLTSKAGKKLALSALSASHKLGNARVALLRLPSPKCSDNTENSCEDSDGNDENSYNDLPSVLYHLAAKGVDIDRNTAALYARCYLEDPDNASELYIERCQYQSDTAKQFSTKFEELVSQSADDSPETLQAYFEQGVSGLQGLDVDIAVGSHTILCNGRVLPILGAKYVFGENAFVELVQMELSPRVVGVDSELRAILGERIMSTREYADTVMRASSIAEFYSLAHQPDGIFKYQWGTQRLDIHKELTNADDVRFVIGDPTTANVRIQAVIDPLSKNGQKWASILKAFSTLDGISVEIWCNPVSTYSELPLDRFYRYEIQPELQFDSTTGSSVRPCSHVQLFTKRASIYFGTGCAWTVACYTYKFCSRSR